MYKKLIYVFFINFANVKLTTLDSITNLSEYTDIYMLTAVQLLKKDEDSKKFVDRPLKRNIKEVIENFKQIENKFNIVRHEDDNTLFKLIPWGDDGKKIRQQYLVCTENIKNTDLEKYKSDLDEFVDKNFYCTGADFKNIKPRDYKSEPDFLSKINSVDLKGKGKLLIEKLCNLCRSTHNYEFESSLIQLKHTFFVSGGRFREMYYWDSYFIIEGLYILGMEDSAFDIIKNFVDLVNKLSYIPNGTRKYYKRSQPPFFGLMLEMAYEKGNETVKKYILSDGFDALIKEYNFWMENRAIEIEFDDEKHILNVYSVKSDFPRIESFKEDIEAYLESGREDIFSELKSACESGWDFSSRWFRDGKNLTTIATSKRIPVDLNCLLYKTELIISEFSKIKGDLKISKKYVELAKNRFNSINKVLYNKELGIWADYDTETGSHITGRFYFSNLFPLFVKIPFSNKKIYFRVINYYQKEIFGYIGGIPASGEGVETDQQWDFPNVWPVAHHIIFKIFDNMGEEQMAFHVAKVLYDSVMNGIENVGTVFEKYSALKPGDSGAGGEYRVQNEFGWTCTTIILFIGRFGDRLTLHFSHSDSFERIKEILSAKINNNEVSPRI
ncbi:Trehalase [Dictyocoela muelleri]|nr:Trehalase [Dictyocoela muelleri]